MTVLHLGRLTMLPPNGTGDTWSGSIISAITETEGGVYIPGSPPQYSGSAYLNANGNLTLGVGYSASDADNDPLGTRSYQWQTSNSAAGTYTDIPGATSATYTTTSTGFFRVKVTPTATAGISPGTAVYSQPIEVSSMPM